MASRFGLGCCCGVQPCTCECEAGDITLDFDAGGWTDEACDACDAVAGEIVLTQTGCTWEYIEAADCTSDACQATDDDCCKTLLDLYITACVVKDGGSFRWKVTVDWTGTCVDPCPSRSAEEIHAHPPAVGDYETCVASRAFARYLSDPFSDCPEFPVTLTKDLDEPGDFCDGALPATITLDA